MKRSYRGCLCNEEEANTRVFDIRSGDQRSSGSETVPHFTIAETIDDFGLVMVFSLETSGVREISLVEQRTLNWPDHLANKEP